MIKNLESEENGGERHTFYWQFYEALRWPNRFLKFGGMFPFFDLKTMVLLKESKNALIYSSCFVIFYSVVTLAAIFFLLTDDKDILGVPKEALLILMLVLSLPGGIYGVVEAYQVRFIMYEIYEGLIDIDYTLSKINIFVDYGVVRLQMKRFILFLLGVFSARGLLLLYLTEFPLYFGIFQILLHFPKLAVTMQFNIVLVTIGNRFGVIKKGTHTLGQNSLAKTEKFVRDINVLCRCHHTLYSIGHKLEVAFAKQILLISIAGNVNILQQVTMIYVFIFNRIYEQQFLLFIYCLLWLAEEQLATTYVIKCCEDLYEQANHFGAYVHQICTDLHNDLRGRELNLMALYSLQMLHQKFMFTVYGLVAVDNSLIYTCFVANVTYLMMYVQYDIRSHDFERKLY